MKLIMSFSPFCYFSLGSKFNFQLFILEQPQSVLSVGFLILIFSFQAGDIR
jgi:hypothetical protein